MEPPTPSPLPKVEENPTTFLDELIKENQGPASESPKIEVADNMDELPVERKTSIRMMPQSRRHSRRQSIMKTIQAVMVADSVIQSGVGDDTSEEETES